jgi:hypothetical protein
VAIKLISVGDAFGFPTGRLLGANGTNCTKVVGVTGTCAEADRRGGTVSEAVDVAVIVTEGVDVAHGILVERVYVMFAPLAVWFGAFWFPELKVPQGVTPGGHPLAVQSTPPEAMSLVTVAVNVAGTPAVIGCVVSATDIG